MAFVTTQTGATWGGGNTPALIVVTGTYLSSAGDTGGVVSPGYTNASGTLTAVPSSAYNTSGNASGCTQILSAIFTPTLSDATAPGGVKAFNATRSRDEFTLVTTANTGGTYTLICTNNGAQP
jgi:hypothetical protein